MCIRDRFSGQTFSNLKLKQESWGGYNVDWENSVRTSDIAFTVFLEVKDDIADNVGKISIAEADFFSTTDANGDAVLDTQLVDLVFSQISAVQGSLQDIEFVNLLLHLDLHVRFLFHFYEVQCECHVCLRHISQLTDMTDLKQKVFCILFWKIAIDILLRFKT